MNKTIAVFLRHGPKWDPHKPVREQAYWDDHASFMDALFDAGQVILGGPFADDSGTLVILSVAGLDAAREILAQDPWKQRDILIAAEFKEWTIFLDGRNKT